MIVDMKLERRPSMFEDESDGLVLTITDEENTQQELVLCWHNKYGLWASKQHARHPHEIAAYMRMFADKLETIA